MKNATRALTSTFGTFVGLIGIEHGLGEMLQGNVAPDGVMILSWPTSKFFEVLAGEPAMTIVPNLLVTGILAIFTSLIFLVWATLFVQRKHGGLVLILLSIVMLLVGGGIFPPILGIVLGAIGTKINAPLTWWRTHLSVNMRHFLGKAWVWSFAAGLTAWLLMFPGLVILSYFFGVNDPTLILVLLLCMFGFLFSTLVTGFAYNIQNQTNLHPTAR